MSNPYDEDYFLRGKEKGVSLYENYRWMPDLTIQMVKRIVEHCGIDKKDTILDFGCARGYVVKAFRQLGHIAYGIDVSKWAIENQDPEVDQFVMCDTEFAGEYDWVVAKDVLEHVPEVEQTIDNLMSGANKGVFVVVPLSLFNGEPYIVADYEKDVTHLHRLCLSSWAKMFMRPGWSVEARYLLDGVKGNYAKWERGNGFITARRI